MVEASLMLCARMAAKVTECEKALRRARLTLQDLGDLLVEPARWHNGRGGSDVCCRRAAEYCAPELPGGAEQARRGAVRVGAQGAGVLVAIGKAVSAGPFRVLRRHYHTQALTTHSSCCACSGDG